VDYAHRKLSARYPTDLGAWRALTTHYREVMRAKDLRSLFSRDKGRANKFTMTAGNLTLDYSKNHVNATTRKLLVRLAKEAQVPQAIAAMFAGDKINVTENRSVRRCVPRCRTRSRSTWTVCSKSGKR
jgi:glucose-6-phosphate isomerase